jgi:hypothetical protein
MSRMWALASSVWLEWLVYSPTVINELMTDTKELDWTKINSLGYLNKKQ